MSPHVAFVELSMTGAGERTLAYCRERSYETTLLTRMPERCADLAVLPDRVIGCDTNDRTELLDTIRGLDARRHVDGVTTTADFYVPQAALAAEALGLPGMPYRAAAEVRNKHAMRRNLARHCPHLNPHFALVESEEEALRVAAEWGLPLIAKPQDANDSWQVLRVESVLELVEYVREASRWGSNSAGQPLASGVLLESYIEGAEYGVESVQAKGGEIRFLGLTGKELFAADGRHFVEIGATFPAVEPQAGLIYREVREALGSLGVDCGVIHTECRVSGGAVKILEINPRMAGDMLGSHAIELALGASAIPLVVETALGGPLRWEPTRQEGSALYGVSMPRPGRFGGIENLDEVRAMPGFADLKVVARTGDRIGAPPTSNGDFVARLVTRGPTADEALTLARRAAERARVRVLGDR